MKLRNKRTGQEGNFIINKDHFECTDLEYVPEYRSLCELNAEWEDYKPTEPLIKDEKIRKVVRAWAEVNDIDPTTKLKFDEDDLRLSTESSCIEFEVYQSFEKLEDGKTYTIAELCGEEEE